MFMKDYFEEKKMKKKIQVLDPDEVPTKCRAWSGSQLFDIMIVIRIMMI